MVILLACKCCSFIKDITLQHAASANYISNTFKIFHLIPVGCFSLVSFSSRTMHEQRKSRQLFCNSKLYLTLYFLHCYITIIPHMFVTETIKMEKER